jgi:hypothetical protein
MLAKTASSVLTNLGAISAKPFAFLTVIAYGGLWFIFQRKTLGWHGIATLGSPAPAPPRIYSRPRADRLSLDESSGGQGRLWWRQ